MYCKAGFKHYDLADCEHIVTLPQPAKRVFELPSDFYSDEAVKRRREENKGKYGPRKVGSNRPKIMAVVNRGEE